MKESPNASADSYALDDTLAGRVIQALGVASCVAVPDVVKGRWPIAGARVGVLAVTVVTAGLANSVVESEEELQIDVVGEEASPLSTWAIISGAAAALGGLAAVEGRLASWLRKKGRKRPHTLLGAVIGAGVFALSEREYRKSQEAASAEAEEN